MPNPITAIASVLVELVVASKAVQLLVLSGWVALGQVAASVAERANVLLNLSTILVVVLVAIPVARSKRKDGTIKELQESNDAKDGRIKDLRDEVEERSVACRQIEQGAVHLQTELAKAQAKYEELEKYAAGPAVAHFEEMLAEHSAAVAARHALMLDQGERQTAALAKVTAALDELQRRLVESR